MVESMEGSSVQHAKAYLVSDTTGLLALLFDAAAMDWVFKQWTQKGRCLVFTELSLDALRNLGWWHPYRWLALTAFHVFLHRHKSLRRRLDIAAGRAPSDESSPLRVNLETLSASEELCRTSPPWADPLKDEPDKSFLWAAVFAARLDVPGTATYIFSCRGQVYPAQVRGLVRTPALLD